MANRKPVDRAKLAKVLARMDSDHPGEALTAARQAARMMRECGLTWAELLGAPDDPQAAIARGGGDRSMTYAAWTGSLRKASRWQVVDAVRPRRLG